MDIQYQVLGDENNMLNNMLMVTCSGTDVQIREKKKLDVDPTSSFFIILLDCKDKVLLLKKDLILALDRSLTLLVSDLG